jgi:acyl carrier protein
MQIETHDAKKVISIALGVDDVEIPNNASIGNFKRWDSLGHFKIVLQLESTIRRSLQTDEVLSIVDIPSIQKILNTS